MDVLGVLGLRLGPFIERCLPGEADEEARSRRVLVVASKRKKPLLVDSSARDPHGRVTRRTRSRDEERGYPTHRVGRAAAALAYAAS
jgi:hypothetical protein